MVFWKRLAVLGAFAGGVALAIIYLRHLFMLITEQTNSFALAIIATAIAGLIVFAALFAWVEETL